MSSFLLLIVKEEFIVSEQLGEELVIEVSGEEKEEKIKEKKVNNKITINPELKESISEIGGEVLFISEVEEIDSIAESVHIELIEEGYSEEQGCGSNQVCY